MFARLTVYENVDLTLAAEVSSGSSRWRAIRSAISPAIADR